MRHVIVRAMTNAVAVSAALDMLRGFLAADDRIHVFTSASNAPMVAAFARHWPAMRATVDPSTCSWPEMIRSVSDCDLGDVLLYDAAAQGSVDVLTALSTRATRPGIGLVAPLLLDMEGRVLEAGRLANGDGGSSALGAGDPRDLPEYSCDRHVDALTIAAAALPAESVAQVRGARADASVEDALHACGRPVVVTPCACVVLPTGGRAATEGADRGARDAGDRRFRGGAHILIGAAAPTTDVVGAASRLAGVGVLVTLAAMRCPEADRLAWPSSEAGADGVRLSVLERGGDDAGSRHARLRDLLERHAFDSALLWTPGAGRWFLPRIHSRAPAVRVVARVASAWRDTVPRHLVAQAKRHWLSADAFLQAVTLR